MVSKYDKQLKAQVVHEICEEGKSTSKTALNYGIPLKTVERWVTIYHKDPNAFEEPSKNQSSEERVKELENEIRKLRRQSEILKKTLILLSKNE